MKYTITWGKKLVRVDYFGNITNNDIESAHLELNKDERFYDCQHLILDISNCNMDNVSVPELELVVAIELGASRTNQSLKVAMIANDQTNIEKASNYIKQFYLHKSPWDFKIFNSINDANVWFES